MFFFFLITHFELSIGDRAVKNRNIVSALMNLIFLGCMEERELTQALKDLLHE